MLRCCVRLRLQVLYVMIIEKTVLLAKRAGAAGAVIDLTCSWFARDGQGLVRVIPLLLQGLACRVGLAEQTLSAAFVGARLEESIRSSVEGLNGTTWELVDSVYFAALRNRAAI